MLEFFGVLLGIASVGSMMLGFVILAYRIFEGEWPWVASRREREKRERRGY